MVSRERKSLGVKVAVLVKLFNDLTQSSILTNLIDHESRINRETIQIRYSPSSVPSVTITFEDVSMHQVICRFAPHCVGPDLNRWSLRDSAVDCSRFTGLKHIGVFIPVD